jgi:serine/threonine protein kinase
MHEGLELGGRYRMAERLGRDGMGEVWRAVDLRLDRAVAVKLLPRESDDPGGVARFPREVQLAAGLQHPGITVVHDMDEHEHLIFVVMEFLPGEDLGKVLTRQQAGLPAEEVLAIAIQLTKALAAAHARGIVHRDIKPANLIVNSDGCVKICDFGIARFVEFATRLTGNGSTGTPAYMAPEQFEGKDVDGRTDLYALGCVLHELLCGRPPFPTDGGMAVLQNSHLHVSPPGPRTVNADISEDLDRLILDLLAKVPGDRPADAAAVTQRLQSISAGYASNAGLPPAALSPGAAPTSWAPPGPATAPPPPPSAGQSPQAAELAAQHLLAEEHCDNGRFAEALTLADGVVRARIGLLGLDHVDTLSSRHLVGTALYMLDREAESEPVVHSVAQARSLVLGPHDPRTLSSWHLLAKILYVLERHADALAIAHGVAETRAQVLGRDDPETLDSYNTVGWTLHMLNRNHEVLPLAQQVTQARTRILGPEHEDTLDSMQLVGWIHHSLGQRAEAHAVAARLHEICMRLFGPQDEKTVHANSLLTAR